MTRFAVLSRDCLIETIGEMASRGVRRPRLRIADRSGQWRNSRIRRADRLHGSREAVTPMSEAVSAGIAFIHVPSFAAARNGR